MGKQSRRKKGGAKKSKQKKLAQAQEQEQEQEERVTDNAPIEKGERVWYNSACRVEGSDRKEETIPDWQLGVVKSIFQGGEDSPYVPFYQILPVESDDTLQALVTIPTASGGVFRDSLGWTQRFRKGDHVLCYNCDYRWTPAIVDEIGPRGDLEVDNVRDGNEFCYRCFMNVPGFPNDGMLVKSDHDCYVRKRPTSFRFSVGDAVIFSSKVAARIAPSIREPWVHGKVTAVDVYGRDDYYAAYELSYIDRNKTKTCHVFKDDDKHVASVERSTRDRLFDSIEQNCDYDHIHYIVTSSNMDVAPFQDVLVSKAIESASYPMLLWLQENVSLDLNRIRDDFGDGLLHQISKSPNSERFFLAARTAKQERLQNTTDKHIFLFEEGHNETMFDQKNKRGRLWLHELIISGNMRALDVALSPELGLAWEIAAWLRQEVYDARSLLDILEFTNDANGANIKETARCLGRFQMEKVVDEFLSFFLLYDLSKKLIEECNYIGSKFPVPYAKSLSKFDGEEPSSVARRLIRFHRRWSTVGQAMKSMLPLDSVIMILAQAGHVEGLTWLCEDDCSLLNVAPVSRPTSANVNEFTEPDVSQMVHTSEFNCMEETLGLVDVVAAGMRFYEEQGLDIHVCVGYRKLLWKFAELLRSRGNGEEEVSFVAFIRSYEDGDIEDFLLYKLKLLQDDKSLERRIRVLNYFSSKLQQFTPPCAIDVIRWRENGVLRWLVSESFVKLQDTASLDPRLSERIDDLTFLGQNKIPKSMTVGEFLCFASIEFDDLQTFAWLVDEKRINVSELCVNGWNVLHCMGYFGRSEIYLWLASKRTLLPEESLRHLLNKKCTRKTLGGLFASHLAIDQGFTFLANLLLEAGCPSGDSSGIPLYVRGRKSDLEHVREWANRFEAPLCLETDVRHLLQILLDESCDADDVKAHISASECLDAKRWLECEYSSWKLGPAGMTYLGILDLCSTVNDADFIVWLCEVLSPLHCVAFESDEFWKSYVLGMRNDVSINDSATIGAFVRKHKDGFLCRCLANSWCRGISCLEPSQANPILSRLLLQCKSNSQVSSALQMFRDKLFRIEILQNMRTAALEEVVKSFVQGGRPDFLANTIEIAVEVSREQAAEEGRDLDYFFPESGLVFSDGRINLDYLMYACSYGRNHPLRCMVGWYNRSVVSNEFPLYTVLAIEGYDELLSWSQTNGRSNWDTHKEMAAVKIAAYLGHTTVVDYFLWKPLDKDDASSRAPYFHAAALGAIEAGREEDLTRYLDELCTIGLPPDTIVEDLRNLPPPMFQHLRFLDSNKREVLASSLTGSLVFGCLCGNGSTLQSGRSPEIVETDYLDIVQRMISTSFVDVGTLMQVVASIMRDVSELHCFERCSDLLRCLMLDFELEVWSSYDYILIINEEYLGECFDQEAFRHVAIGHFKLMASHGFDIQSLKVECTIPWRDGPSKAFANALSALQAQQLLTWSQFDCVTEGRPLEVLQAAVENKDISMSSRYRDGLLLTHVAAAYDRLDILQWLVESKGMSLDAVDGLGQTVMKVAESSHALTTSAWISVHSACNMISMFASSHFRRRRALKLRLRRLRSVMTLQAWYRGNSVRRVYRGQLAVRLEARQRFQQIWERSIELLPSVSVLNDFTWAAIKEHEHDTVCVTETVGDMDLFSKTTQKLEEATTQALSGVDEQEYAACDYVIPDEDKNPAGEFETSSTQQPTANFSRIKLTKAVVKWLRQGDNKYREFFVRRMKQLAAGDRSRILAKRLAGSKAVIFETYLEQKSGHRIIWTEGVDQSLLIWYVAKHKDVSRFAGLIDDAQSRSSRQLTLASALPEIREGGERTDSVVEGEDTVVLDPLGDTPLKLFEVHPNEIEKLRDPKWKPRLYLTPREREVVETTGTVLLLGRSGTGKTCIICNRMDYDRQRAEGQTEFSQLFVARSQRLCEYVKETVGSSGHVDGCPPRFATFVEVVQTVEKSLPISEQNVTTLFLPSQKMDFGRFKREVFQSEVSSNLDALVIWTNIRSFIKGSIEALQRTDGVLSKEDYIALGIRRCRLSEEQREFVYDVYILYEKHVKALGLWDDCDRITAIVRRLEYARVADSAAFQDIKYSKLYIDEVQDYTQAEIALFFYMGGPGDLFLSGDPAQSVVEGVEFRFEEVRSVGYHLYGEERRHLIPEKPKTVHVNFRSHCGILNVAASLLTCLFQVFPDSAKQLKEDRGLFFGPRPGVFHKVEAMRLQELVVKRKGIVILTHDRDVSQWKRALRGYPLVYGIREAKGLEFKEVIIVDFFIGLPEYIQKLWRDLLLGRDTAEISQRPEIEGHLKLLYTAVTRCIQRLFFAETSSSVAGNAFIRWLTTTSTRPVSVRCRKEALAIKSSIDSVEKMVRTPDEWRSAGLDNAAMADTCDDLEKAEGWLEKAVYCFEQVGDTALVSRARVHRSSLQFRVTLDETIRSNGVAVNVSKTEVDVALLTEKLLSERLFLEAKELCSMILPLLAGAYLGIFEDEVLRKIPSLDSDNV